MYKETFPKTENSLMNREIEFLIHENCKIYVNPNIVNYNITVNI